MTKSTSEPIVQPADLDKEAGGGMRLLEGPYKKAAAIIAVLFSAFAIYSNGLSNIQEIYRNLIFLGILLVMTFFYYPAGKSSNQKRFTAPDYVFAALAIAGLGYLLLNYTTIHVDRGSQPIMIDYVFGAITIIVLLEASRRAVGIFIPILCGGAIVYALFGTYFPWIFGHAGFSLERLLYRLYMTTEGVLGLTLSTASTFIVMFVLFGAFLSVSGATQLFNDLALAIAGRKRGGPAQVAVISSALTGSLSGSAVANVATTGAFTIPLMKSIGLKPKFAGAVEAAASTGGMIMPPIMGAAAFIMAGFLGISYTTVILAAIIPSFLYYIALIFAIDIEAKKQGLKGISKENIPDVVQILKERGVLLIPIIVVITTLLMGKTALFAGFAGIGAVIIASWLAKDKSSRITISKTIEAFIEGGRGTIQVGIACAAIGIIICVVTMTGIGSTLAYNIVELTGGQLWLILIVVMLTCIVLSMGLPSTALYIVVAVTAAPALVEAGVNPIAAHFFVFWFGALSNITPPVALASYTAAGLAGANAMQTSWEALRISLPGFIIPFMIAYNPIILLQAAEGETISILSVALVVITSTLGIYALASSLGNYLNAKLTIVERVLMFAGALMLIKPGMITDIAGFGLCVFAILFHIIRVKKSSSVEITI
ncbi:TRAP transporter permease [Cytobacillus firmus]|jgi:TRAP transporter 4TM/12TM fusion protein|uniref:TRAP transporter permease n=1 Tax=Cytobacillus firmus TaxID=1399 RepID=A0AA46PFN7_CYTFI|nr:MULTISPECIES: TRAP transporter permease [Cytobacillus]KML39314.1 C4-dicarboxylate ABC transporter permease [Cytobacillus firmus]MBG9449405.1 C4-dicarboxylate ABC transporter permease [Cytobacillus firmus]MCC3649188.1 TRAP transporter permease [Cytobacillus oceanisediminis]MCS0655530.1 TRAP transporter permease [Cytobacillus firmus]MCU1807802.1 TRAP transporter permease [Cytobacillus firmus]